MIAEAQAQATQTAQQAASTGFLDTLSPDAITILLAILGATIALATLIMRTTARLDADRRETQRRFDEHQRETRRLFDEHQRDTRQRLDEHQRDTQRRLDEHQRETRRLFDIVMERLARVEGKLDLLLQGLQIRIEPKNTKPE